MSTENVHKFKLDPAAAVDHLQRVRSGGPWALTAIVPDGPIKTVTVTTVAAVIEFILDNGYKCNLYYAVNPLRASVSKKARKVDVVAIEYILGDLDPREGETPDAAKARYRGQLNGTFKPVPTAEVDSGNGIQGLWKLADRIELGEPITVNGKLAYAPEDQAKIDDVEARMQALMLRLGSVAGTQNIDRILRLPGTINFPNKKKRNEGRVACETRLIQFNDTVYPLDTFPRPMDGDTYSTDDTTTEFDETTRTKKAKTKKAERKVGRDVDELQRRIREKAPKGERSDAVWFVVNEMLQRGYLVKAIVKVLLDRGNGISEHIYDQRNPRDYAERQVEQAIERIEFTRNDTGKIYQNASNIHIAMLKLGVTVRYDRFGDRTLLEGLPEFGPILDDAAVNRLWLLFEQRFRFQPRNELMFIVLQDTARLNSFHPVRDYLDGLQWDGVPRLDEWLIRYAGAEDSRYTRAVGALTLIAAVRRIRQPGCKSDEMLVLEQSVQGTDKSSALAILAAHEDWFTDDLPLNVEGKRVIEVLRGRWIVEAAELSGMKKADVEHLKAMLSRRIDRARMAWGRLPMEAPRQCVIIGTTNKSEYLRDTTGNRRFWPVLINVFDLDALRRDREMLWAEAAAREAKGESIRLAPELWPDAAEQQRQRLADDPFVAVLDSWLGRYENGRIKAVDVWTLLDLRGAQLTQDVYQRTAEAMKRLGWERPNKAGTARFHGQLATAYVRGVGKPIIFVLPRDQDGGPYVRSEDEQAAKDAATATVL